jgi:hypothetical protein
LSGKHQLNVVMAGLVPAISIQRTQRPTNRDARHEAGPDASAVAFIAIGLSISGAIVAVAIVVALALWALIRGSAA